MAREYCLIIVVCPSPAWTDKEPTWLRLHHQDCVAQNLREAKLQICERDDKRHRWYHSFGPEPSNSWKLSSLWKWEFPDIACSPFTLSLPRIPSPSQRSHNWPCFDCRSVSTSLHFSPFRRLPMAKLSLILRGLSIIQAHCKHFLLTPCTHMSLQVLCTSLWRYRWAQDSATIHLGQHHPKFKSFKTPKATCDIQATLVAQDGS